MDEFMQSQETSDSMVMSTQPSPTSRASPTKICAMVDSLDTFKKSLVEEMESGGILHVPHISRMNLKLSIWLMSRVDEVSRTIYIRPGRQMSFRASDVHKVFGVPCGPLHIQKASALDTTHMRNFMHISQHGKNLLTVVEKIIYRPLDKDSSDREISSFKMAFVMFVVGYLLTQSPSHDCTNTQYWGALAQIDHVAEFNGCEYLLEELMAACLRVKADIRAGRDVTYLHVCHLFLQVFYLDNLDLGSLNLSHNTFPRISAFDETQYKRMWVQCNVGHFKGTPDFSGAMIRSADQVCYARSAWDTPSDPVPCDNSMFPGRLACFNNTVPGSSRPHGAPLFTNAQPISFRLPHGPHGVPPSPATPAPTFTRAATAGDFLMYMKANYPKLATSKIGMLMKKHNATTFRLANSLKTDLFAEDTAFLNALVSELGEGCICCSLRTLPCIINNPPSPDSPCCTNIYRRKLDMADSDGEIFAGHHQRGSCRFSHASTIQEPGYRPIFSRRTERIVGRACRFNYDAGRRGHTHRRDSGFWSGIS
ncbi:hypothetical protein CFC21_034151 [Triticum aestivum]|uniref:Uncharacterized protein n=2 Tax=Triticum aestivum TaxID=4565 RepID=A0A9R1F2F0_WHEAT|nr:hypothetical protein CFC21_034151 [Triticum aestivum]